MMMQVGLRSKVPSVRLNNKLLFGRGQTSVNVGRSVVGWNDDEVECYARLNDNNNNNNFSLLQSTTTRWYSTGNQLLKSTTASLTSESGVSSSSIVPPVVLPLDAPPKLTVVPTLPYVGSLLSFHSGMPTRSPDNEYEWQLQMRAKYGDFFSYGIPGLGSGTHGIMYQVSDPREFMKVVRQEGRYPYGMASSLWPVVRYSTEKDVSVARGPDGGFFGRSDDWKLYRNFLQTDLLSPQSASGYMPGVIAAAEYASKGAPSSTDQLNQYLNRCAFDMFCTIMFGELVQVADPNTPTDPENVEFITNAVTFLNLSTLMVTDVKELFAYSALNMKTKQYKEFETAADNVFRISREKVRRFQQMYEDGTLNEYQRDSYLANAIRRQREQVTTGDDNDGVITEEMMIDICVLLLTASVDTTSGIMSFALLHMALNPDVQEKLYQEIRSNMVSNENGRLTAEVVRRRAVAPYLHAVLRESHRLTPTTPNSIMKQVSTEVDIHGVTIPANTLVLFNNYGVQMDPLYIEDPETFRPERWLPDAVEARKGTPYEVLDHPFFKDPFSQGARKCPGSRVAVNEVLCFLSQLILDYEIRTPSHIKSYKDVPTTLMGVYAPVLPKLEFIPRQH